MGTLVGRSRNAVSMLVGIIALVFVSGCAPVTPVNVVVEPPQVPETLQGVDIEAPVDAITLTRLDMPAGFQLAAEKQEGPEYVALYLRPAALDPAASGGNTLLSVLTTVGVYTTTAEAENVYLAAANPTQQAIQDVALVSRNATDIITEDFEGAAVGADAAEAFRVTYKLMGQSVYEYGHRMRLGNTLVYVVVAAIGNPEEPSHLLKDARNLVQRQIDKIVEAVGPDAPE